jgi:hypothetical protein
MDQFGLDLGVEVAGGGGAAAPSGCGRCGWCAGEVGVALATWGGWGPRVGAGKGGGDLGLACSRPEVVPRRGGSGGGHEWSAGARLGAMHGGQ